MNIPHLPCAVTNGTFSTAEHVLILNHGQFHAAGTGQIGNQFDPAAIDFAYDYNRDGRVNATDVLLAREHQTAFVNVLRLIEPAGLGVPLAAASPAEGDDLDTSVPPVDMPWLAKYDPSKQRTTRLPLAASPDSPPITANRIRVEGECQMPELR